MSSRADPSFWIGVDVGGTFTDVVVIDGDGRRTLSKAFTTKEHEAHGVLTGLETAAAELDMTLEALLRRAVRFVHGTTMPTNVLLERRGARLAFVTTAGFRDTLIIRRSFRPDMFDLTANPPPNFLERTNVVEVAERVGARGEVVTPMTDSVVEDVLERLAELDVEAVGICLLFAPLAPEHEQRLEAAIAERFPERFVTRSTALASEIRDYERASTTAVHAYLGPRISVYVGDLGELLSRHGLTLPIEIMASHGGLITVAEAIRTPGRLLLSGPAGGVTATLKHVHQFDSANLVTFDLGGTSCDVSVITGGKTVQSTHLPRHTRFDGWDVLGATLDIQAIGVGGGSIAWTDGERDLHVGPRSAGSEPGPACYGRGGAQPTVTDANLYLGYLDADTFFAGKLHLDGPAAASALDGLGNAVDLETPELAGGILRISSASMADRIRVVLAEQAADARDYALVCFGGAGGLQAPALLSELPLSHVIIPAQAAGFSALGLLYADVVAEEVSSIGRALESVAPSELGAVVADLDRAARDRVATASVPVLHVTSEVTLDMRYVGQTHELGVVIETDASLATEDLREAFESHYEQSFGYRSPEVGVELLAVKVRAVGEVADPPSPEIGTNEPAEWPAAYERTVRLPDDEKPQSVPVHRMDDSRPGATAHGPAILELPFSTALILRDQVATLDAFNNAVIRRAAESRSPDLEVAA